MKNLVFRIPCLYLQRLSSVSQSSLYITQRNVSKISESLQPSLLIKRLIAYIDDVTGATEIREAHATLRKNEKNLQDAQNIRRKKREDLDQLQTRMKEIHGELDRYSRGDDKYLRLLTEEHAIIKSEQTLLGEVQRADEAEKLAFDQLSSSLRISYAKEQEQAGRVKTWTVIASTIGALLGIFSAWLANEIRMRNFKALIPNAAALTPLVKDITGLIEKQQIEVATFIKEMREALNLSAAEGLADVASGRKVVDEVPSGELVELLREQNSLLTKELEEIKRLIAIELNMKSETPNVVYIGSDMEELLSKSEKSIESKMKLQTLVEVVFLYALITVSIPLIYAFFKSN